MKINVPSVFYLLNSIFIINNAQDMAASCKISPWTVTLSYGKKSHTQLHSELGWPWVCSELCAAKAV